MPLHGAIDIDRGVSMRQVVKFESQHKFLPDPAYGGLVVYMYKDDPGKYFDAHGRAVADAIAKIAGFDIERHAKMRRRNETMAEFARALDEELRTESGDEVILASKGGWKVVALPMERAKIVDEDTGALVTAVPMTRDDALLLLDKLAGVKEDIDAISNGKKGKA